MIMELNLIDDFGQVIAGGYVASTATFGCALNEGLLHQVVVAYMANARNGTRAQKGRDTVAHSTRKPYAQKGTGNARAGMTSSPIWRGGGRAFPNSPQENFTHKLNRKVYRAGIRVILSTLVREERISVIGDFSIGAPKTSILATKLKTMNCANGVLILVDSLERDLSLAARNLINVAVIEVQHVDPVSLLRFPKVIATVAAIKKLEEMLV